MTCEGMGVNCVTKQKSGYQLPARFSIIWKISFPLAQSACIFRLYYYLLKYMVVKPSKKLPCCLHLSKGEKFRKRKQFPKNFPKISRILPTRVAFQFFHRYSSTQTLNNRVVRENHRSFEQLEIHFRKRKQIPKNFSKCSRIVPTRVALQYLHRDYSYCHRKLQKL